MPSNRLVLRQLHDRSFVAEPSGARDLALVLWLKYQLLPPVGSLEVLEEAPLELGHHFLKHRLSLAGRHLLHVMVQWYLD